MGKKLKCGKCGCDFESQGHRKNCFDCTPKRIVRTLKDCRKKASLCETRGEFKLKFRNYYQKAHKMGWIDIICDHMRSHFTEHSLARCQDLLEDGMSRSDFAERYPNEYKWVSSNNLKDKLFEGIPSKHIDWTLEECHEVAKKCKTRVEFGKRFNKQYQWADRQDKLDEICSHMTPLLHYWTFSDCLDACKQCETRSEFREKFSRQYAKAVRKDWLLKIYDILLMPRNDYHGYSRTAFVDICESKNRHGATLYLIKCKGNSEEFYKIGITSRSLKERYAYKMPYDYEVLWRVRGNPADIWDLEAGIKSRITHIRYQPELWCSKSTETFKCHGNCKILRKPLFT